MKLTITYSILFFILFSVCSLHAVDQRGSSFLGPIGEYRSENGNHYLVIRPLLGIASKKQDLMVNVLGPAMIYQQSETEHYFRFLSLFYSSNEFRQSHSYGFLPLFYYHQKPELQNIFIFLFYGDLTNFLSYERIQFVMLPFYFSSQKRGIQEYSCFWPLVSWKHGESLDYLRIFPFYMQKTIPGESRSTAIMWPFVNLVQSLGPANIAHGWHIWPFAGFLTDGVNTRWAFLWPLFQFTSMLENGDDIREYCILWPFFEMQTDRTNHIIKKFFLGPFWGFRQNGKSSFNYVGWPFCTYSTNYFTDRFNSTFRLLPFYWHDIQYDLAGNSQELNRHVWPLYSYYKDSGGTEIRIVDLLPIRNIPYLSGLLAPFWYFARLTENADLSETTIFWGLYRNSEYHQRASASPTPEKEAQSNITDNGIKREMSILYGLFKHRTLVNQKKRVVFFWFLEF